MQQNYLPLQALKTEVDFAVKYDSMKRNLPRQSKRTYKMAIFSTLESIFGPEVRVSWPGPKKNLYHPITSTLLWLAT